MGELKEYKKYVYWFQEKEFQCLKNHSEQEGIKLVEAKNAACDILSKGMEVGFVPVEAWGKNPFCKRPSSWYKASSFVGQILVISSFDLCEYHMTPETIIRECRFRPPRLPNREEKLRLINQKRYQQSKPGEWEDIDAEGPELHNQWLKAIGLRGVSFEELFITHRANHANFIEPTYFVLEENEPVPYSIDKTSHICSACLEFFNIIGSNHRKKYVVPCPGAVLYAGMIPNRYYEVLQLQI
ncbi:MAG: hypothetical protein HXY44_15055 [Syntrophaceae bacterium]|nr:hypothetical protein [Syntrophaceae bacterium]